MNIYNIARTAVVPEVKESLCDNCAFPQKKHVSCRKTMKFQITSDIVTFIFLVQIMTAFHVVSKRAWFQNSYMEFLYLDTVYSNIIQHLSN